MTLLSDTQTGEAPCRACFSWTPGTAGRAARGHDDGGQCLRAVPSRRPARRRGEDHGSLAPRASASWAGADGPGGALDKTKIWDYSPENLERIQRGKEMRDREVQRLRNPEEAEQGHIPLAPLNFADIAAIQAR